MSTIPARDFPSDTPSDAVMDNNTTGSYFADTGLTDDSQRWGSELLAEMSEDESTTSALTEERRNEILIKIRDLIELAELSLREAFDLIAEIGVPKELSSDDPDEQLRLSQERQALLLQLVQCQDDLSRDDLEIET
ncbi:hypothetical protein EW146_g1902 [Bondarzewia mesenterica]|uniref:Uncharacterized protein n=1 Tax=Bondarzewia mesenterica TaxID=1095465 RepID=A0A4S4M475_9AGAM|nr:hypothetical protein EW146_g1902 [Bondarzewia mesenterica]